MEIYDDFQGCTDNEVRIPPTETALFCSGHARPPRRPRCVQKSWMRPRPRAPRTSAASRLASSRMVSRSDSGLCRHGESRSGPPRTHRVGAAVRSRSVRLAATARCSRTLQTTTCSSPIARIASSPARRCGRHRPRSVPRLCCPLHACAWRLVEP